MSNSVIRSSPSCQDPLQAHALDVADALAIIERRTQPLDEIEDVPLQGALGRVLARSVVSPTNVPPGDNSAMDGYAVRGEDLPESGVRELVVVGTAFAGHPFAGAVGPGQGVQIMTGAPMPVQTDTVVIQEHTARNGDRVTIDSRHKTGQNVRKAGESVAAGQNVLNAGQRIGPAQLGLLASMGVANVAVCRQPRVALFSTGDEIRSLGEPLGPGEIYDSNRYTLHAMLRELGVQVMDLGIVPDRADRIRSAIGDATDTADMVITTGGVSAGLADHIGPLLAELGQIAFWKVALKPGHPLAFGKVQETLFFGLPGNPVAVMVTFYQFVRPALKRLMGESTLSVPRLRARCTSALKKSPGRTEYQRGILASGTDEELTVTTTGSQGSGVLASMHAANCFIVLPPQSGPVAPGDIVDVQPFDLLRT